MSATFIATPPAAGDTTNPKTRLSIRSLGAGDDDRIWICSVSSSGNGAEYEAETAEL